MPRPRRRGRETCDAVRRRATPCAEQGEEGDVEQTRNCLYFGLFVVLLESAPGASLMCSWRPRRRGRSAEDPYRSPPASPSSSSPNLKLLAPLAAEDAALLAALLAALVSLGDLDTAVEQRKRREPRALHSARRRHAGARAQARAHGARRDDQRGPQLDEAKHDGRVARRAQESIAEREQRGKVLKAAACTRSIAILRDQAVSSLVGTDFARLVQAKVPCSR